MKRLLRIVVAGQEAAMRKHFQRVLRRMGDEVVFAAQTGRACRTCWNCARFFRCSQSALNLEQSWPGNFVIRARGAALEPGPTAHLA